MFLGKKKSFLSCLSAFYPWMTCFCLTLSSPGVISGHPDSVSKVYSPKKTQKKLEPSQWLLLLSQSLDKVKKLYAQITQINPITSTNQKEEPAKAILYLERPGKLRLNYMPPSIEIMAAKGKILYHDILRKHVQSMSLSQSPVSFLLTGKLHDQVLLREIIYRPNNHITLIVQLKKDPNGEKISLTFDSAQLLRSPHIFPLIGWSITNVHQKTTTITLSDVRQNQNVVIPKGAFEFAPK